MKDRTNFIKAIGFFFGLIILIFLASMLFRREDKLFVYNSLVVYMRGQDILAEPENSLDVLFCGDSESIASFSPKILYKEYGYNSYVCGTAGQKLCDSYIILNEAFKTQSPSIVVLETNTIFRHIKNPDEQNDIIMDLMTDNIPLFSNHSDWKKHARKLIPESYNPTRRKERGFIVRKKVKPYTGGEYMVKTEKKEDIPDDTLPYLNQIARLCKKKNVTMLLVSAPSAKNWTYEKHNGIKEWAQNNDIKFIDLNLENNLDINWEKDTLDRGDHVNYNGAKKVTKYMGEYFKNNFELTDHRKISD